VINMARWQRYMYGFGEALLFGGLLWGLYRMFVLRACPATVFNDTTLIVLGVILAVAPLHPFKPALYLRIGLRGTPLGLIWWLLALAGLGYCMYVRLSIPVPPDNWWFAGLVPAGLYFWLAIEAKRRTDPPPSAPPAPPQEGRDG
jgi:hypothetical protein